MYYYYIEAKQPKGKAMYRDYLKITLGNLKTELANTNGEAKDEASIGNLSEAQRLREHANGLRRDIRATRARLTRR